MRESLSSYTTVLIIDEEKAETPRLAIIHSCLELRPLDGPFAVHRTDLGTANDQNLKSHRISIELGHFKNANKNLVAERAVQEVWEHILRIDSTARAVSSLLLSFAVASVNSSIPQGGLSARKMLTQRD